MPRPTESTIQLGDDAEDYNDWLEDQEEDDFDELERLRDGPSNATKQLVNGKSNTLDTKDDGKKKEDVEKKMRKKIVRVTLDAKRLCGVVAPGTPSTGLPTLVKDFTDVKWLGKGHEDEDLMILMQKLEGWAHRMFPKFKFDDVLEKVERLGSKREVRTCVKRLMNGDPVRPEDFFPKEVSPTEPSSTDHIEIFPVRKDDRMPGKTVTTTSSVKKTNLQTPVEVIPDDDFDSYFVDLDEMTGESLTKTVEEIDEDPEAVFMRDVVGLENEEHISGIDEALDFINS